MFLLAACIMGVSCLAYSLPPELGGDTFLWQISRFSVRVRVTFQLTVSQYVLVSSPIWDFWPEIFFFFWKLLSCHLGVLSLTRGRVSPLSIQSKIVTVFTYKIYNEVDFQFTTQSLYWVRASCCACNSERVRCCEGRIVVLIHYYTALRLRRKAHRNHCCEHFSTTSREANCQKPLQIQDGHLIFNFQTTNFHDFFDDVWVASRFMAISHMLITNMPVITL
jgi:hypothetical protein